MKLYFFSLIHDGLSMNILAMFHDGVSMKVDTSVILV